MMKEKNELSKKWESLTFAFFNTKIGSQPKQSPNGQVGNFI